VRDQINSLSKLATIQREKFDTNRNLTSKRPCSVRCSIVRSIKLHKNTSKSRETIPLSVVQKLKLITVEKSFSISHIYCRAVRVTQPNLSTVYIGNRMIQSSVGPMVLQLASKIFKVRMAWFGEQCINLFACEKKVVLDPPPSLFVQYFAAAVRVQILQIDSNIFLMAHMVYQYVFYQP
jgi:hypothetical protein